MNVVVVCVEVAVRHLPITMRHHIESVPENDQTVALSLRHVHAESRLQFTSFKCSTASK